MSCLSIVRSVANWQNLSYKFINVFSSDNETISRSWQLIFYLYFHSIYLKEDVTSKIYDHLKYNLVNLMDQINNKNIIFKLSLRLIIICISSIPDLHLNLFEVSNIIATFENKGLFTNKVTKFKKKPII